MLDKGVENRRNPWGPATVFLGIIKGVIDVLKLLRMGIFKPPSSAFLR
jgi:hypothetical protein